MSGRSSGSSSEFGRYLGGPDRNWPHFLTAPDHSPRYENGVFRHTARNAANGLKIRRTFVGLYRFKSDSGHHIKDLRQLLEIFKQLDLIVRARFGRSDQLSTGLGAGCAACNPRRKATRFFANTRFLTRVYGIPMTRAMSTGRRPAA